MTQYMLSVHDDPADAVPEGEELQKLFAAVDTFNQKVQAEGAWVFACGLAPVESATVVDGRGSEVIVVDGPYVESKEHLGGFWIIEAPDLDVAKRLAAEASAACRGPVEVRPFEAE